MKQRLIILLIYTLIVVGGSFLLQNQPNFDSMLYLLTALSFVVSAVSLFSGNTNQSYNFKVTEEDYFEERNKTKVIKNMDLKTFMTCVYIAVPFLLAVYLFAN